MMPKPLSQLLDDRQMPIDGFVQIAEELSGYPSEDVRLMSDLATNARSVLNQLNLDPADTTASELYHALLVEYKKASDNFSRQIGEKTTDSAARRLKRIVQVVAHGQAQRQVWALKKTVAKQLLKNHQPKKLMAALHYRSLDSMLKRENIGLIYAALRYTESPRWLKLMQKSYVSLNSKDFEIRDAEFIAAPGGRWAIIAVKARSISNVNELGVIIFWPNLQADRIASLGLSILGLRAADELRCSSAWLKLHQFNPSFSKLLSGNSTVSLSSHVKIADGQSVTWSAIARAFASRPKTDFPQSFEPHLEKSDLNRQTPSNLLLGLVPHLHLWADCEYLLFSDTNGLSVSCNLADMAINYAGVRPLRKHDRSAGTQMLKEQLISRYLTHQGFERHILRAIENSVSGHPDDYAETVNFNKFGAVTNRRLKVV